MSQGQAIKTSSPEMVHLREAAEHHSRSIADQAEHWLRLGRAVESDPRFGFARVDQALRGLLKVDDLSEDERDLYFDQLPHQAASADVVKAYAELGAKPDAWGMDEAGNLVRSIPAE